MNEFISISEYLPKCYSEVEVLKLDGNTQIAFYSREYGGIWLQRKGTDKVKGITHFRPTKKSGKIKI